LLRKPPARSINDSKLSINRPETSFQKLYNSRKLKQQQELLKITSDVVKTTKEKRSLSEKLNYNMQESNSKK
jgi:hypothetical protein